MLQRCEISLMCESAHHRTRGGRRNQTCHAKSLRQVEREKSSSPVSEERLWGGVEEWLEKDAPDLADSS